MGVQRRGGGGERVHISAFSSNCIWSPPDVATVVSVRVRAPGGVAGELTTKYPILERSGTPEALPPPFCRL